MQMTFIGAGTNFAHIERKSKIECIISTLIVQIWITG